LISWASVLTLVGFMPLGGKTFRCSSARMAINYNWRPI
jgi:hypothetical protein